MLLYIIYLFCSKLRRENILEELVTTEANYVQDLEAVIKGYKNTLEKTFIGYKAGQVY